MGPGPVRVWVAFSGSHMGKEVITCLQGKMDRHYKMLKERLQTRQDAEGEVVAWATVVLGHGSISLSEQHWELLGVAFVFVLL